MGIATITMQFPDNKNLFPVCKTIADTWLGQQVTFKLGGKQFTGEVVETERVHLCNGEHDILTVEIWDRGAQIKIQAHRQKFRRIHD